MQFDNGLSENNALEMTGFESDLGFGLDEVMSSSGDSGGPRFLDGAIAGVAGTGARSVCTPCIESLGDLPRRLVTQPPSSLGACDPVVSGRIPALDRKSVV